MAMRPARSRARAGAATGFAAMSGRPASRRLFATRAAYHPCPAQHARCHSLCPRFTPNTRLTHARPPALAPTEQDDGLGAGCTGRLRAPGDGSLRPSPHRALSCGTEAGRYLLLDQIGEGAMGAIYATRSSIGAWLSSWSSPSPARAASRREAAAGCSAKLRPPRACPIRTSSRPSTSASSATRSSSRWSW